MNENSDAELEIELAQIAARLQLLKDKKQPFNREQATQAVKVRELIDHLSPGPFGSASIPPSGQNPEIDGLDDGPRNNPNFF
jgi:hypothetical protein